MPLRCLEPSSGLSLLAFDLSADAWAALEADNKRWRHLRLPCCEAEVVLRRSKLGTPYFAHKAVGACAATGETETHRRLKQLVVEVARASGWEAQTEVAGETPDGEPWRADVLARKGRACVAIEVQLSPQTDKEAFRRQERYRLSGVRGLWLFGQASFPMSETLPAARVVDTRQGFTAVLAGPGGAQKLPMAGFLDAAFSGRLRFSLPLGVDARVTIHSGCLFCWSCKAKTEILAGVDVQAGPHKASLRIPALHEHPELWDAVRRLVPSSPLLGTDQTHGRMRHVCHRCGEPFSEFDELNAWHGLKVLGEASIRLGEPWREVLCRRGAPVAGWAVF